MTTEGMEPEDKTIDYQEYDDPESDNLESDSENPEVSEDQSESTIVRSNFVLPDPGKTDLWPRAMHDGTVLHQFLTFDIPFDFYVSP